MYKEFKIVKKKKKKEFVECINSWKFDGKSMNVPNHENSKKNRVHRWTNSPNLLTNLILLRVQNNENSMENYVH